MTYVLGLAHHMTRAWTSSHSIATSIPSGEGADIERLEVSMPIQGRNPRHVPGHWHLEGMLGLLLCSRSQRIRLNS
jgi:hypothetical protein